MRLDSNPNVLKRAAIEIGFRSGFSRAVARHFAGAGAIYMFHSVVPDRSACLAPGLSTSVQFLDRLLASFRRFDIDIIGFDDLTSRLRDASGRRFVVATFDDGYSDNLQHALPIFEKHNAPLTVFVTTGMVTGNLFCWWTALERLFLRNPTVEIAPMAKRWVTTTAAEKTRAYAEASDWVSRDIAGRASQLRQTFIQYGLSMPEIVKSVGLSIGQLRTLGRHPLVTIGGHTDGHPELTRLTPGEARDEIVANKRFLENALQKPVEHFAYPYGAFGQREANLARDARYKTAVTTNDGCLFEQHVRSPHALPRIGIGQYESIALAHLKIDGFGSALRRSMKMVRA